MRKIILLLLICVPMLSMAQNVWERPQDEQPQKQAKPKQNTPRTDTKYLVGAVPEINGKVVFTLDVDASGKSAQDIYDKTYALLDSITKESNQFKESKIALVNKRDHIIAAVFKEWLIFRNSLISLDRTEFDYTIIATCTDGHLHATLERMSYNYEEGLKTGFKLAAEDIITDKHGLNKSQTKLNTAYAKFRIKTIDRKDYIFNAMTNALR